MNGITRTLILGVGAVGAALILSIPATAGESTDARDSRHRFAQVGGHGGQGRGARSDFRGPRLDSALHQDRFHVQRVHYRGHYRRGHGHWRGYHWRRYHWRGHRPYWRLYRHHPRNGQSYGYGYGRL